MSALVTSHELHLPSIMVGDAGDAGCHVACSLSDFTGEVFRSFTYFKNQISY